MSYRDIAKAQLRSDEGVKESAYTDSLGYLTIGVGRLIDPRIGGRLYQDEIDYLLERDLDRAEAIAKTLFPTFANLSDARKAVLLNMAHNLGQARLAAFHGFREAVVAGDWGRAADEMLDSRWADQVGERAKRLARQFKEG